jgi:E3 ubiquitin-protein ligase HECTD2
VEILVCCGSPTMDMLELKKVTVYDGYKPNDDTIIFFWEVRKYVLRRF